MIRGEVLLGCWAQVVVAGLAQHGVRHLIVSPGSRSTPFLLAALRQERLTCWSVPDERSAGFFALGQAKLTGEPTALLCTSGTAGAHFLPALLEADASGVPLVVLTADRPHELVHCGAPQTIEQTRLFSAYVRFACDLGNPDPRPAALRGVSRRIAQAVSLARGPRPGPTHINARAAKPLEPAEPVSSAELALATLANELVRAPPASSPSRLVPTAERVAELARRLASARHGMIFCGALTPAQAPPVALVHELARRTGFPLVCETTSQLRWSSGDAELQPCESFEALLLDPVARRRVTPELMLQLGAAPLAAGWNDWLRPPPERLVLSAHGWADPTQTATLLMEGDLTEALALLLERLPPTTGDLYALRVAYRERVQAVARDAGRAVDAVLARGSPGLSEGIAVATVLRRLPASSSLVIGSSLLLRAVDLFGPVLDAPRPVIAHRGVNGIDGLVSTAAGVASVHGVTTLLVGDVSFLHDLGGLWTATRVAAPLVVVVFNDGGGRIFEGLPLAAVASSRELGFFTTPQAFEFEYAARLFGHHYRRVSSPPELIAALGTAYGVAGLSLIEVSLAADEPQRELQQLRTAMVQALGAERGQTAP